MRDRLAAWLESIWYGREPVPGVLALLERCYVAMLALRRALYASRMLRSEALPRPVVVVGNLTAGGTGKTPLVVWLVRELSLRGWQPGVILRGYRGSARSPRRVTAGDDAAAVGDEALLIARATGVPVAIGRRRAQAGRLLVDSCDVLVSDDGLQHWALQRDIEIAVVDGERRYGNGRLLPAGPLREPLERLSRVDHVVANGAAHPGEVAMQLSGSRAVSLCDPTRIVALESLRGRTVHAVAGIGNPARFFALLRGFGIEVVPHPYPDHHDYDGRELDLPGSDLILVTEKDAVKCASFAGARVHVVPVEAELPAQLADQVHASLHRLKEARA
ncbi:MAG TPA: tetraacyldisaccharide 4'-kinase [Candidatus Saccharimonadia bacterium]|nr:tetraacyldisaccharide 4'-kinase [Candidatus Saccharimonadia bacterium]